MKIILSPAKKMRVNTDIAEAVTIPVFIEEAGKISDYLKRKSLEELKSLWACNDRIAEENYERVKNIDLERNLTPAILSYDGIAYQYMAPTIFEYSQFEYVQKHLRILSGFYGVLKPMDGVVPYRLEMQAKAAIGSYRNLYEFWADKIYKEVREADGIIINLASKEYSKCVEKYLTDKDVFISCEFVEEVGGKYVTKGTYAKMARGEMVRFIAEKGIKIPEEIKDFDRLNYSYRKDLSDSKRYVFERKTR